MLSNPAYDAAIAELAKREAQRQYQREWRRDNPDKVKAQRERYWQKKGQKYMEQLAQKVET